MQTLLIVLVLANGIDAGLTMRNYGRPGFYEENPVMRPVLRSKVSIGIAFSAESVAEVVVFKGFRRHRKLEAIGLGAALASEAWGIETSVHGVRK